VWLPHSSLGFQRPVGRRSYHNKLRLTREVCVTPQAWLVVLDFPIFPALRNGGAQNVDFGSGNRRKWGFSLLKF